MGGGEKWQCQLSWWTTSSSTSSTRNVAAQDHPSILSLPDERQDTGLMELHPSFALPSKPAGVSPLPSTSSRRSLPTCLNSHQNRQAGTPSHPISPLLNIHTHQVDPLLFPPGPPINPSLFRWCKWRPHQHHPPRSCRCSVHSLPAARTWSPPWTTVWDGARYQSRGWIDGIYFGGMGRGGPYSFPLLFSPSFLEGDLDAWGVGCPCLSPRRARCDGERGEWDLESSWNDIVHPFSDWSLCWVLAGHL